MFVGWLNLVGAFLLPLAPLDVLQFSYPRRVISPYTLLVWIRFMKVEILFWIDTKKMQVCVLHWEFFSWLTILLFAKYFDKVKDEVIWWIIHGDCKGSFHLLLSFTGNLSRDSSVIVWRQRLADSNCLEGFHCSYCDKFGDSLFYLSFFLFLYKYKNEKIPFKSLANEWRILISKIKTLKNRIYHETSNQNQQSQFENSRSLYWNITSEKQIAICYSLMYLFKKAPCYTFPTHFHNFA